jgi:hypothetical protein
MRLECLSIVRYQQVFTSSLQLPVAAQTRVSLDQLRYGVGANGLGKSAAFQQKSDSLAVSHL